MKPETRRRVRSALTRPLMSIFKVGVGIASWKAAQRVGSLLGLGLWRLGRRDRQRSLTHLELAFPDMAEAQRRQLARRAARSLGISLAEYFHLAHRGPEAAVAHIEIRGWEHVEAARSQASLVMIATGHCGNWELMGPVFRSRQQVLTGLVRSLEDEWMETAINRFRKRLGSELIPRGQASSVSRLLGLRRRGGFLLALIDQDIRAQSVFVPFFGRPAHTPVGPALMAIRWSMPVVPGFCERRDDGSHLIRFEPKLPHTEDAERLTAAITRVIEQQVRRRPDQWVWMHRRWRRRPEDGPWQKSGKLGDRKPNSRE